MNSEIDDDLNSEYPEQIGLYKLTRTCYSHPEQYDVTLNGEQAAYLRLRHGCFTVTVPNVRGVTILKLYPEGDGVFLDSERLKYLILAIKAIEFYGK